MKHIASVSFGKDSLAMLLLLIKKGCPLDEVVFYNNGMEFQAIYHTRDAVLPLLREAGIAYTELRAADDFRYKMFSLPVNGKKSFHYGYSWCGGPCRWGTTDKLRALESYCKGSIEYVGLAADETSRLAKQRKGRKVFPLAEWGLAERDCKRYCYRNGFRWQENGYELYRLLKRVSCWCCSNKNLLELKNIYLYLPDYWRQLKELQLQTPRPMKGEGKSVQQLEERFARELVSAKTR